MLELSAKKREVLGKKVKILRKKDVLPAVLYGPNIENLNLEVSFKEFEKIYKKAGETSLIKLKVTQSSPLETKTREEKVEEFLVLIHQIQFDPLTNKPIHVDFYQPLLEEKVEINVPIIIEGEAPAVKELGGTLVKNISEVRVKSLPQKLPHEIRVDINGLKTFEDKILVKDLKVPEGVKILRDLEEIVVFVSPPEKVEEELSKPIEEKVEEIERVEKKEKASEI